MTWAGWDWQEFECTCSHQRMVKGGLGVFLLRPSPMFKSADIIKSNQENLCEIMIAYFFGSVVRPHLISLDLMLGACQTLEEATFGMRSARWSCHG